MIKFRINKLNFLLALLFSFLIDCDMNMLTEQTKIFELEPIKLSDAPGAQHYPAWSPDGTMIAFSQYLTPTRFMRYSIAGENLGTLCRIEDEIDGKPVISPDGSKIAFYADHRGYIWIFSLSDSSTQLLTPEQKWALDPAWSADGKYIAFINHGIDGINLFIIPSSGGSSQQITFGDGMRYSTPGWSPDGKEIAVTAFSYDTNYSDIWIVSVEDGSIRKLTSDPESDEYPAWSPDGSQIAFASNRAYTYNFNLWVMPAHGGEMKKLTQNDSDVQYPSWSPDGSNIAFQSYFDGYCSDVGIVTSDGENMSRITFNVSQYPQWLADGTLICTKEDNEISNIGVVTLANSQFEAVTPKTEGQKTYHPVWFPDNDKIAFSQEHRIWTTSYSEKIMKQYIDERSYNPAISFDGLRLLYDNKIDIFLKNLENGDTVNLTSAIYTYTYLSNPVWSPDGEKIACTEGSWNLKIFKIDSTLLTQETEITGRFYNVCWSGLNSNFGSHIVYDDGYDVYMITPPGTEPVRLIKNATEPCWSPDASKIAYVYFNQIYIRTIFEDFEKR